MNELYRRMLPQAKVNDLFGLQIPQGPQFRALAERVYRTGEPARLSEVEAELGTGDHGWYNLLLHPAFNEAGAIDGVVIVGTDVTALVEARRALDEQAERTRRAEARLQAILEQVPLFVLTIDPAGRVLFVAGGEVRRRGGNPSRLPGSNILDLVGDDAPTAAVWRRAIAGEDFTALVARPTGATYEIWFRAVRDAAGRLEMTTGVGIDVTERERAQQERARIQEKMLQAQKLESLGVLAGGIAHDFNNLLTAILGNATVALAPAAAGACRARESLDEILVATQRAADLTRQMLAYSGKGRFEMRPLDLRAAGARDRPSCWPARSPKKVKLRARGAFVPARPCEADASQMQQVVMNLIINAAEAIGDGDGGDGLASDEPGRRGRAAATWPAASGCPRADYVCFSRSRDTGCGMDETTRARIFDPFFTTKFTGRGLGLAAVLGIVRGHGGAMRIESAPGHGTTFDVLLPAAGAQARSRRRARRPRRAARAPSSSSTTSRRSAPRPRGCCRRGLRRPRGRGRRAGPGGLPAAGGRNRRGGARPDHAAPLRRGDAGPSARGRPEGAGGVLQRLRGERGRRAARPAPPGGGAAEAVHPPAARRGAAGGAGVTFAARPA